MTKLSPLEKFFVNRRGKWSFNRLVSKMKDSSAVKIDGDTRILELGGGNGVLSHLLYENYHPSSIYLTDFDQDQVDLARSYLKGEFGDIPEAFMLQQADASKLKYEDGSFEVVIARMILHHLGRIENIFAGLNEIARVLVPDGTLILVEFAHKREITEHIEELGFTIVYRKGLHSETVIAVKGLA